MSLWNGFDISRFIDKQTGNLQEDVVLLTIDLGHGQCSAAFAEKGFIARPDLKFDNEKEIIPSAICYAEGKLKSVIERPENPGVSIILKIPRHISMMSSEVIQKDS